MDLYKAIKLIFIVLSTVMQCVNLNTVSIKDNRLSMKVCYCNNKSDQNAQLVMLKPFKCYYRYMSCRSSNLLLWKRRRRVLSDMIKLPEKTDKIRHRREVERVNSYMLNVRDNDSVPRKGLRYSPVGVSLVARFKQQWPVHLWRRYAYTDDYLMLINSHWLRFPPPDPAINYALGALYVLMMVVGCTGNALVLFMYIKCRSLRTAGNILVANLALSDFLMLAKTPVFIFNSFNLGPALGKPGCIIYGFLGGLTGATSIATLSAIALDRYWAVVRPLEPLRALTAIRARLLAVAAWLYAALFASIPAFDFGYGHYVPEAYLTSCSFDYLTEEQAPRYFIFVFFCAAWVAPFCTISFCYLSIFRVVVCNRNISTTNQEQRLSTRHVKERAKRKAEIKLAFLVMAVIALFFISWTPYAVVALLGIAGKKDLITPITSMVPALFCKTAACINPFIYIITHPKFRNEFKKLLYRDKSKHMGGTMKTTGYYTDTTKVHRPSKDLSDTESQIIEMRDIPYQDEVVPSTGTKLKTISSKVCEREDSLKSVSMKSFEESVVSPPSWYAKPKFAKKKSFHRRSTRSIISLKTDPSIST
ncbi:opsin, ultraviolet-sensitive-like [Ostrinia furnacalis]|uniref:opsin, ultraviolet-sensitive-like n=1 Tax=Ostrinia furnacalis TaxID=93504 RepID=UPI00103F4463|nr:opsin, ultraviolet-sensitive-like [Ostrinia furnacalis]